MSTQIRHLAINTDNWALVGRFYHAVFRMRTSANARPEGAVAVSDGYVGLNVNTRRAGRQAGLDHFGFEVDDAAAVLARIRDLYPSIDVLKRPSNRPFAGLSSHDPAGNVFDLSQKGMENRTDVYEEGGWKQTRSIHHFALRTIIPDIVAKFYVEVFDLRPLERPVEDPNYYLTDGKVTLIISPWKINDYQGSGIERPALDHIGFKVESLEAFKNDLDRILGVNPSLSPKPTGAGPEGQARLKLFSRCVYGHYHFADPDGVLIDVTDDANLANPENIR